MRVAFALILAVAALGAACGGDDSPLTDTAWALTELDGEQALPEVSPILRFDSGDRLTGSTGCNTLGGTWKSSGDQLSITEIVTTLIGCPGPIGEQEQAFNAALSDIWTYAIAAEVLTLFDRDGMPRMTLRRLDGTER